jgi:cytochrome c6
MKDKGDCMKSAFGLFFVIALISAVVLGETTRSATDTGAGKKIYATNCVTCHGPDGKGSSMGRATGVKDLHSPEVVKMTPAQMKRVISNGKGNMPPWKGQLSDAQITEVMAFVRSLQKGTAK